MHKKIESTSFEYIVRKYQLPSKMLWIFKGGSRDNIPFLVNFSKRGTKCHPMTHPSNHPYSAFVSLVSSFETIQCRLFHLYISIYIARIPYLYLKSIYVFYISYPYPQYLYIDVSNNQDHFRSTVDVF